MVSCGEVLMLQLFCLYTYAHRNMYMQISDIHIKTFSPVSLSFITFFSAYGVLRVTKSPKSHLEMIRSNESFSQAYNLNRQEHFVLQRS